MFHQRKINLRHVAVYIVSMLFLVVLLPYASIKFFPGLVEHEEGATYEGEIPKTVKVYITAKKKYERIPLEKYVQGVVASEMPDSFELEALKAQSVASRTYALGRIHSGAKLCDTVHCQVYRSDHISDKVKEAVNETKGQVLLYDGKLASHALYFASSAGKTENSEEVFSGAFPYLVSVSSSYEPGATHKREKQTMSIDSFSAKIKAHMPELHFGKIKRSNIRIKSHSKGGRVKAVKVGREIISGADVRGALVLYSARFKLSFKGKNITITSSGSGHGVGMSQYGANGLAKKGEGYKKILTHYYKGTTVSK